MSGVKFVIYLPTLGEYILEIHYMQEPLAVSTFASCLFYVFVHASFRLLYAALRLANK